MRTIGNTHRAHPAEWMVARLQRWCTEWALEQALREDEQGAERPATPALDHGETPTVPGMPEGRPAGPLSPGTVALLVPRAALPPQYVLLLGAFDGPGVLCIPFSRFTEPGVPGELLSGMDADGLRVLCLWNTRRIATAESLAGWVLQSYPEKEAERVRRAYAAVAETGTLPADLVECGGPPLSHPDDPRRQYLRDARQRMDEHLGTQGGNRRTYPPAPHTAWTHLRAAEDREPYGDDLSPGTEERHDEP